MATKIATLQSGSSIAANMLGVHISQHPEIFEPARSNCFDLCINDIDEILPEGVRAELAEEGDYLYNGSDVIRLSIENFPVPQYELTTINVRRVNSDIKFAGRPQWSSGTFKCTDFVGARTKDVLMALRAQAYDVNNDVINAAEKYKHTWEVFEYSPDYKKKLRTWTLYGAWISKVTEEPYSHDSNERRSIDVTVEYDRAIPTYDDELTELGRREL